jgi:undecaprenyl-diphosphatase
MIGMLFRILSVTGGPVPRTFFVAAGALGLLGAGRKDDALFLAATVGGTGATNSTIKRIVRRRRPHRWRHLGRAEHDSFPSGHTSGTCALTGAATYLFWRSSPRSPVALMSLLCSALVSSVMAYSRVRLGRHHTSDVLAGFVLGLAGLALGVAGRRRLDRVD